MSIIVQLNDRERARAPFSPSSLGEKEPNFNGQIGPNCKIAFCHKDEKFVFPVDKAN